MASITFAVDESLKSKIEKFPWVNWSEVAREKLLWQAELEELSRKLETKEEQEIIKWSVELGREVKKGRFKRLLAELSPEKREALLSKLSPEKRREVLK